MKRAPHLLAVLLIVALQASAAPPTSGAPTAGEVIRRIQGTTEGLKDLRVDLRIRLTSLGLTMPLQGRLYYKSPGKVKLDLEGVPKMLKDRKSAFSAMIPASLSLKDYRAGTVKTVRLSSMACWYMILEPRKKEKLRQLHVWVDCASLTTPRLVGYYRDGSVIDTVSEFEKMGRYSLPSRQTICFDLPSLRCDARVAFSGYRINSGLSDSLFTAAPLPPRRQESANLTANR